MWCSGDLCIGRSLILDWNNICVGCFKVVHPVCGRALDEDGNKLCFACDTKPEEDVASVDSYATLSDVADGVLEALEEEEALYPLPVLWSVNLRTRSPTTTSAAIASNTMNASASETPESASNINTYSIAARKSANNRNTATMAASTTASDTATMAASASAIASNAVGTPSSTASTSSEESSVGTITEDPVTPLKTKTRATPSDSPSTRLRRSRASATTPFALSTAAEPEGSTMPPPNTKGSSKTISKEETGRSSSQDHITTEEGQGSCCENQKGVQGQRSSLPNGVEIGAHTAEVLRQVDGADVVDGGWVGGDAWFGSVLTAVEVKVSLNVDSTWIIKGNHAFYPMEALHAILKGRFENKISGHWFSMTAIIGGVKLLALCYAWSQKGVSYFLSTCGSIHQSSVMYQSNFEDDFGNVSSKFLPRTQVCHFLYELLPLIDEHNKQSQYVLGLERRAGVLEW
jgi:hypothetical protein